jgi:hypothetical protein
VVVAVEVANRYLFRLKADWVIYGGGEGNAAARSSGHGQQVARKDGQGDSREKCKSHCGKRTSAPMLARDRARIVRAHRGFSFLVAEDFSRR